MEWFNIHTSTLDSEEFLCSDPVDQATWLKLERYCIGQENGGIIRGAKEWSDRQWQHMVRATLKEVLHDCKLWEWVGYDLKVKFYPVAKELEIKAKRAAAEATHAKRLAKRHAEDGAELDAEHREKEMEGNGKELEGADAAALAQDSEAIIPSLEECLQWGQSAGVPGDWVRAKHLNTTGTHGWIRHGKLILWQTLWKAWFEEDRVSGRWQKNPAPRTGSESSNDVPPPPGVAAVDFNAMRS